MPTGPRTIAGHRDPMVDGRGAGRGVVANTLSSTATGRGASASLHRSPTQGHAGPRLPLSTTRRAVRASV